MCMHGMGIMVPLVVPWVASESAMSFPLILVWALTFWIVILCLNYVMYWTIDAISSLSIWLCWEDGCLTWLSMKWMLLRLSVKICMSWLTSCVLASTNQIACSSALRMFWNPESLYAICMLLSWLYTPDPTRFLFLLPFGGIKGPISVDALGWVVFWWLGVLSSVDILWVCVRGSVDIG